MKMSTSRATEDLEKCYLTRIDRLEYSKKNAELYQRTFGNLQRCEECKYLTRSLFCLQNHLKRHKVAEREFNCQDSTPEEYFCIECNFSTHLKAYFKQHIRNCHCLKKRNEDTKLVVKTYTCEECLFWTYSELVLIKHQMNSRCINRKHSTEKEMEDVDYVLEDGHKWCICQHCNYRAKQKHLLKSHILHKHTPSNRIQWFKCEECTYKAKTKSGLKKHIKWHKGELCEDRTKSSILSTIYREHAYSYLYPEQNINVNDELYCKYSTLDSSDLNDNVYSKHKFKCNHCEYTAVVKSSLKRHILYKHTADEDINWFACDKCEFKFKIKNDLTRHLAKHSFVKSFKCHQCEYKCNRKSALKQHKLKMH